MPALTPEQIPESQQENSRELIRLQTKDGLRELRADLERARSFKSYSPEFREKLQKGVTYDDLIGVLESGSEKLSVPKVFALQILLTELGINPIQNLDGIYANKVRQPLQTAEKKTRPRSMTERAVIDFQERFRSKYPDVIGKNERDGVFRQKYTAILRQELQQELPQKLSAQVIPELNSVQKTELEAFFKGQTKTSSQKVDWPFISELPDASTGRGPTGDQTELPEAVMRVDLPQVVQRKARLQPKEAISPDPVKIAPKEALSPAEFALSSQDFASPTGKDISVMGIEPRGDNLFLISFRDHEGRAVSNLFRLQDIPGGFGTTLQQLVLINPQKNSAAPEFTWTRNAQAGEKFDLDAFPLFKLRELATGK